MTRGERAVGIVGLETADDAPSPILLPKCKANWPVILPVRALTFDATIILKPASATDSESRRVEVQLSKTAVATPHRQPSPNPRVIFVAWHVVGSNYRQAVHSINFHWECHETCAAGQVENADGPVSSPSPCVSDTFQA